MLQSCLQPNRVEVGVDEVGRGCLAGPVVAAAVILPSDYEHPLLDDSKKLTAKKRDQLREEITRDAVAYAIAEASVEEIDKINILQASMLAMHRALGALSSPFEFILVDGHYFRPYSNVPYACQVKGDGRFAAIAAASILAKTYRDDLMAQLAKDFPDYAWEKNVGYPTVAHRRAIKANGITLWHRKSFQLLPAQLDLPFE
jgi:ribonuclease HII